VGAAGIAASGGSTAGAAGGAGTAGNAAGAPAGGGGATGGQAGAGGQAQAGGAAGSGGDGGNGGSAGYAPCPKDGSACRILPFGDSITFGYGSTDGGGYRSPLYGRIAEAGYRATFVGSQSGGPGQVEGTPFPKQHEGHSGWTIDSGYVSFGQGISTLVPKPAFDTAPHIVLLMIGTNDVGANMGTSSIHERLDRLLDKVVAAAPDALVVVAKLTPIKYNPAPLAPYNAKIADVVNARVAKGQHFALVDMSAMPLADLASDSLHPNDAGYAWMAGTWYTAIEGYLPR
jgi:lysophospholipase L1-like esterase